MDPAPEHWPQVFRSSWLLLYSPEAQSFVCFFVKSFGHHPVLWPYFTLTEDKVGYHAVLRIRIHRINMFLGLQDPDPLVRGMDPDSAPDPDPSIIMQK